MPVITGCRCRVMGRAAARLHDAELVPLGIVHHRPAAELGVTRDLGRPEPDEPAESWPQFEAMKPVPGMPAKPQRRGWMAGRRKVSS